MIQILPPPNYRIIKYKKIKNLYNEILNNMTPCIVKSWISANFTLMLCLF
jgi:hypothetical protein